MKFKTITQKGGGFVSSAVAIHTIRMYDSDMSTNTVKRVNISLPAATLLKIDGLADKGDRSRFINQAVHYYVEAVGQKQLKAALKEGALRNAVRDSSIASEWFHIDESAWPENK